MNVEAMRTFVKTMEARLVRLENTVVEVKSNIESAKTMIAQEESKAPQATGKRS